MRERGRSRSAVERCRRDVPFRSSRIAESNRPLSTEPRCEGVSEEFCHWNRDQL